MNDHQQRLLAYITLALIDQHQASTYIRTITADTDNPTEQTRARALAHAARMLALHLSLTAEQIDTNTNTLPLTSTQLADIEANTTLYPYTLEA